MAYRFCARIARLLYTQAPTLAELEPNIREAVAVYLATIAEEEPIREFPAFVGVQRLEVDA